jgi:hypothetical protein
MVAAWIGVSQGQLSRIETGPPIVHLDRLVQLARLFGIPSTHLWFRLPEDDGPPDTDLPEIRPGPTTINDVDDTLLWAPQSTIEIVDRFTRRDLTLDRREATRTLAGVVFGGALLEPLERWLTGASERDAHGRPGGIGYQEVAQIEHAAQLFRTWDDQFGGGLRRKAVIGQLNEVAELLRDSHPPEIRRRLFGAMAQLAETAAIMSWDSGQQAHAQRYYALALRASKAAGDRAFGACVLAGMARQLLYLNHPGDALELARLAQDGSAGRATATVRAMLHTREAWAYAKQQRVAAFRRATSKAEDAFAAAVPAEDPHWIDYFDAAELAGTTGGRLLELAHEQPKLAAETATHIEKAVALRRPGRLRSSALDKIGLAEARLLQGETEEATRLGHAALDVVDQTPSDRVRVKLAELYQLTTVHAAVPAVAQFRERVRERLAPTG